MEYGDTELCTHIKLTNKHIHASQEAQLQMPSMQKKFVISLTFKSYDEINPKRFNVSTTVTKTIVLPIKDKHFHDFSDQICVYILNTYAYNTLFTFVTACYKTKVQKRNMKCRVGVTKQA